jgi:hypothetical protein
MKECVIKMEQNSTNEERATIILHSGDMDKVYSALIVETARWRWAWK